MESRTKQTLESIKEPLEAGDTDRMLAGAGRLLEGILNEFSDRLSTLEQRPEIGVEILLRCVACKTAEYWSAALELVDSNRAHAAVSLLRPMCEELVFAQFIAQMPRPDADECIRQKGRLEFLENISAEERVFSAMRSVFSFPDLKPRVADEELIARVTAAARAETEAARSFGERVGWGRKAQPTVREMARVTGLEPYYDFIYRAASSAVVQRLGRMVWGDPQTGRFTVTSTTFEQYFRRFVLVYRGWIASFVASEMADCFPSECPEDAHDSLAIIMAFLVKPAVAHEAPRLVTPEEMRWRGASPGQ